MVYNDPQLVNTLQEGLEIFGTLAFAISGIRHAAAKHFDWFGGYVCGVAVAIGGGTIRDLILGVPPFWVTDTKYLLCTGIALFLTIMSRNLMKRLDNAWFVFDTLGLALFTIVAIQKTTALGYPFWVAIVMGCISGVAGGIIRDVLLNNVPVIFHEEIYALASVAGGMLYGFLVFMGVNISIATTIAFLFITITRFVAVRYNIKLPKLKDEEEKKE